MLFLSAGIFQTHIFRIAFCDFRQESDFLALLMVEKGQGLLLTSKKGQGAFLTSEKRGGVGMAPSKKRGHERY